MKILDYTANVFRSLISGAGVYFYLMPAVVPLLYFAALAAGFISGKVRRADKTVLIPLTAALTLSHAALYYAFSERDKELMNISLAFFAAAFVLSSLLYAQSNLKLGLSIGEKRHIGALTAKFQLERPYGATGSVRRIERLCDEQNALDAEPDLGEVLRIIKKIRGVDGLTICEEDELDKTEIDIEKLSHRIPSPSERQRLSDRLMNLIKMMSKYGVTAD
ncbi:MAG: hypothetical protein IJS67_02570 [Clostridia bacterium]|nr:hypothetical protein [Clostridia bacterium]